LCRLCFDWAQKYQSPALAIVKAKFNALGIIKNKDE